jgi:hypothetical protein
MFGRTHSTIQDTTIGTTPADAIALAEIEADLAMLRPGRHERWERARGDQGPRPSALGMTWEALPVRSPSQAIAAWDRRAGHTGASGDESERAARADSHTATARPPPGARAAPTRRLGPSGRARPGNGTRIGPAPRRGRPCRSIAPVHALAHNPLD